DDEYLGDIPFVVLSALYMTRTERDVLGPSVAAVVQKGELTRAELVTALRKALAGRHGEAPGAGPRTRRPTVLAVEDDAADLFTLKQVLVGLPITVETAQTGPEAIERCRHRVPDLILMDLQLPGMSGYETTAAIRALPGCRDVPVVALTARTFKEDREQMREV